MKYVLDRFEGQYAVLESENNNDLVLMRGKLPAAAKEGDIIICESGAYTIDYEATKDIKIKISEKMKKIMKK